MSRGHSPRGLLAAMVLGLAALAIVAPARADALRFRGEATAITGVNVDAPANPFGNAPDGSRLLSFEPVEGGTLPSFDAANPSRVTVATLVVNTPPAGQVVDAAGRFQLGVSLPDLGKWTNHGPSDPMGFTQEHSSVMTQGLVTGRLAADGSTHLTLTAEPFQVGYLGPVVTAGRHVYSFPIDSGRVALIPLDIKLDPGVTTARIPVELQVLPVPEPTAVVPLAGLGFWLLRRRRRRSA